MTIRAEWGLSKHSSCLDLLDAWAASQGASIPHCQDGGPSACHLIEWYESLIDQSEIGSVLSTRLREKIFNGTLLFHVARDISRIPADQIQVLSASRMMDLLQMQDLQVCGVERRGFVQSDGTP